MQKNRKLIIGFGLILLALFSFMLFIRPNLHHEKMMPHKMRIQNSDAMLNDTGSGAQHFQHTCANCHGLPDPKQYTAKEWPHVLVRMQQHMLRAGKAMPDAQKVLGITEFLQRNARPGMSLTD